MDNYDPNIRIGIHTVKITLQVWDYVGHIVRKRGGNCHGIDVLNFDFETEPEFDNEYISNDCNLQFDEEYEIFTCQLKNKDGKTLDIEDDAREMNKIIVALEILDYIEENDKKQTCQTVN